MNEDLESVRAWMHDFADCVRKLDFERAEPMFSAHAFCFGSRADVMPDRAALIARQWRPTWPSTSGFDFDHAGSRCEISDDGLMASLVATWVSTGYNPDGSTFDRPGRATIVLRRRARGLPWQAVHSHYSLFPGTPVISHGRREREG